MQIRERDGRTVYTAREYATQRQVAVYNQWKPAERICPGLRTAVRRPLGRRGSIAAAAYTRTVDWKRITVSSLYQTPVLIDLLTENSAFTSLWTQNPPFRQRPSAANLLLHRLQARGDVGETR